MTEARRDYLAVVRDALDRIAAGTERLIQRVALARTALAAWDALPKIAKFRAWLLAETADDGRRLKALNSIENVKRRVALDRRLRVDPGVYLSQSCRDPPPNGW